MNLRLFRKRQVWVPTLPGMGLILLVAFAAPAVWLLWGEGFLSDSDPIQADLLVVEGWIVPEALPDAVREFRLNEYAGIITTGGLTGSDWSEERWNHAERARDRLIGLGLDEDLVHAASSADSIDDRTFVSATTAKRLIESKFPSTRAINVFTQGTHGRRSQMVFQKAMGPEVDVGVIVWLDPSFERYSWWRSSRRAKDFIQESFGYFYELIFGVRRQIDEQSR